MKQLLFIFLFCTPLLCLTQTFYQYDENGNQVVRGRGGYPSGKLLTQDTTIFAGNQVLLEATGGLSYVWSNDEISPSIQVQPAASQSYHVTITDGCSLQTIDSVLISVLPPSADKEVLLMQELSVFPNPATSISTVYARFEKPVKLQLQLVNSQGHILKSHILSGNVIEHNELLGDLPTGVYYWHLEAGMMSWERAFILMEE